MRVEDQKLFVIEKGGKRYPTAYVFGDGLVNVTVWIAGEWQTKRPTQTGGLSVEAVARLLASEMIAEAGRA